MSKKKDPQVEAIIIVGKFSDNKYRQILLKMENMNLILHTVAALEGSIRILETPIEGIAIQDPPK